MEIRHLRTFMAVAKRLSFIKAAKELHYAQSSVSAQIQSLEEELNVRLFDRLGRSILLTEAGERLQPYAQKMIDLSEETLSDIAGAMTPKGRLIIRVPESMAICHLPAAVARFHEQFPEVQLTFTTCAHEGLRKDLRKGVTDLAFLLTEGIQAGDLKTEILGFEQIVTVSSPRHPLAKRKSLKAGDLGGETLLFSKVDCSYRKTFEEILRREGVQTKRILTFHSVAALKACLTAGIGMTILPETAVSNEIGHGRLTTLPLDEGTFEVAVLMIWYKEKWISPSLRAFMKIVAGQMKGV